MPTKRGRLILINTDDVKVLERRRRTAERTRLYYERRRLATNPPPILYQAELAESIAKQPFEVFEAVQTLLSLGL